jgi:predicted O-methyltransferase YrrM
MKLTALALLVAFAALDASLATTVRAADAHKVSNEDREAFLRSFKRTGLNTTPGDAMMLRILVQTAKARRGIEVGTATGYGALHMGIGFERNGGRLFTIDIDPAMVKAARENLEKVGLENTVTVIQGDALKVLPTLEGEYDFLFIDAAKRDYLKYFLAISPKLKRGALVVADNVIKSAAEMSDFLEFMEKNNDYEKVTIRASEEKGDGMAIYYKVR